MVLKKSFRAIGLMSGPSGDGIDVAYIESDGSTISYFGKSGTYPYSDDFRWLHLQKAINPSFN